jgi:hypothetical protein
MQIFKNRSSFRTKAALLLALPMAALAGCQATVNTRWAEHQDSPEAWQETMTNIPIDVHGAVPGNNTIETVSLVAGGTTSATFGASHPGQTSLDQSRRIELYVNSDKVPAGDSYCAVAPALQSADGKNGTEVVGALCDGPRLVAVEMVHLDPRQFAVAQVPQAVDMFKAKLLDGLAADPNQVPNQYEY